MFSVHKWQGKQTRDISSATIEHIWRGTQEGQPVINILHVYGTWWDRNPAEWIEHVLEPIAKFNQTHPEANLTLIIGTLYGMFVSVDPEHRERAVYLDHRHDWKNHYLDKGALSHFIQTLTKWDNDPRYPERQIIRGWYCFDEPNENGYDLKEYYSLVDVLKNDLKDDLLIYGDVSPDIMTALGNEEKPRPWGNGFRHIKYHWINWDGRLLEADDPRDRNFLIDRDRFPSRDGRYDNRWYFTQWECDVLLIDFYHPQPLIPNSQIVDYYIHDKDNLQDPSNKSGWISWVRAARDSDFVKYGNKRSWREDNHWRLEAVLPGQKGLGTNSPNHPNPNDLQRLIRHLRELQIDGIWFYAWHDFRNNDLQRNWIRREMWSKAVREAKQARSELILISQNSDTINIENLTNQEDTSAQSLSLPSNTTRNLSAIDHITSGDFDGDGQDEWLLKARSIRNRSVLLLTDDLISNPTLHTISPNLSEEILTLSSIDGVWNGFDEPLLSKQNSNNQANIQLKNERVPNLPATTMVTINGLNTPHLIATKDFDGDRDQDIIWSDSEQKLYYTNDTTNLLNSSILLHTFQHQEGELVELAAGHFMPGSANQVVAIIRTNPPICSIILIQPKFIGAKLASVLVNKVGSLNLNSNTIDTNNYDMDNDGIDELLVAESNGENSLVTTIGLFPDFKIRQRYRIQGNPSRMHLVKTYISLSP